MTPARTATPRRSGRRPSRSARSGCPGPIAAVVEKSATKSNARSGGQRGLDDAFHVDGPCDRAYGADAGNHYVQAGTLRLLVSAADASPDLRLREGSARHGHGTRGRDAGRAVGMARLAALIEPGSLLEATPECLVVAHADGRILFANHRVEQLTGFDRAELVGQSVELLIAADVLELAPGARVEAVCRTNGRRRDPGRGAPGTIEGPERAAGGHPPRRLGPEGRPRGAVRSRGQVPGAGRADPGGRLPGPRRRELGLDLREPAGGDAAGHRPGRVAHRSRTAGASTCTPRTSTACGRSTRTPTTTTRR